MKHLEPDGVEMALEVGVWHASVKTTEASKWRGQFVSKKGSFDATTHSTIAIADFRLAGCARNSSRKSKCRIAVELVMDDTVSRW